MASDIWAQAISLRKRQVDHLHMKDAAARAGDLQGIPWLENLNDLRVQEGTATAIEVCSRNAFHG
jgi:hypothetical protein